MLNNINNIIHFVQSVGKHSCHLVTADGGFDFSIDFNKQEQMSYRLLFSQIVAAISIQKQGGHFICKFFDSYTPMTTKFMWLLNCLYDKIIITKPFTSRPANSEKYIIAYNFQGVSEVYLQSLYDALKSWSYLENANNIITDIFEDNLPNMYYNIISSYNTFNTKKQMDSILHTLHLIDTNPDGLKYHDKKKILIKQVKIAVEWCQKYDVSINYRSTFFKETGITPPRKTEFDTLLR